MDILQRWAVDMQCWVLSLPRPCPIRFCKCLEFCANYHPDRLSPVHERLRPPLHDMCPFYFKNRPEIFAFDLVDTEAFDGWKASARMNGGSMLVFSRQWPNEEDICGKAEVVVKYPRAVAEDTLIKYRSWTWPRIGGTSQFYLASDRPMCFTQGTWDAGEDPNDFVAVDEVFGAEKLKDALGRLFP